jgi:hypothetical protein
MPSSCEFVHSPFLDARFSSVTLSGYVEYILSALSLFMFVFQNCSQQEVIPPIDIRNRFPISRYSRLLRRCGLPTSEVIPRRNLLNPVAEKAYVGDLASMDDVLYTRSEVQFANCKECDMNLLLTLRQTEHTFQDLFLTHGRNLVFSWTNGTSLSNASGSSHTASQAVGTGNPSGAWTEQGTISSLDRTDGAGSLDYSVPPATSPN